MTSSYFAIAKCHKRKVTHEAFGKEMKELHKGAPKELERLCIESYASWLVDHKRPSSENCDC